MPEVVGVACLSFIFLELERIPFFGVDFNLTECFEFTIVMYSELLNQHCFHKCIDDIKSKYILCISKYVLYINILYINIYIYIYIILNINIYILINVIYKYILHIICILFLNIFYISKCNFYIYIKLFLSFLSLFIIPNCNFLYLLY